MFVNELENRIVVNDKNQVNIRERCSATALLLCVAHIFSVVGMAYQNSLAGNYKFVLINFSLWLSPVIVLLLYRKVCAIVGSYAIPVLAIFFARVYFALQFYSLGTNSVGDWAWWLATVVGMVSVAGLVVGLFVFIVSFVSNLNGQSRS